jgi:molybdenum-dependent DNA-binding transcriptional regulator ModE
MAHPGPFSSGAPNGERSLSARQSRFAEALAEGATIADGAKAAGISYRTGKRWRHLPAVEEACRLRARENLSQARATLAAGAGRAAASLVRMATDDRRADAAKVSAAVKTLELSARLVEFDELSERLAALEAQEGNRHESR